MWPTSPKASCCQPWRQSKPGGLYIASGHGQALRGFAATLPEANISGGPGENPMELAVNCAAIFDVSQARLELGLAPKFDRNPPLKAARLAAPPTKGGGYRRT